MKTLFMYLPNGMHFRAMNGDQLIKRAESRVRTTFCFEEQKTLGCNAIVPGVTIASANNTQFVHVCPTTYVLIDA